MLTNRIERLKRRYFDTRQSITAERLVLATEAYKKYAGESVPIFRAHVFEYVLDNMTVFIGDDELIVGNVTNAYKGGVFHLEYASTSWIREELDDFPVREEDPYDITPEDKEIMLEYFNYWDGKAMEDRAKEFLPDEIQEAIGDGIISVGSRAYPSSHTLPNYDRILSRGFKGCIEDCEHNIRRERGGTKEKQEKIDFWKGCIIVCNAMIRFAARYADLAEEKAADEDNKTRKEELLTIAKNFRNIPQNQPDGFYEAMQMMFLIHMALHIESNTSGCGYGRVDQFMDPYYQKDLREGKIDEEKAKEILQCFYIKMSEYYCIADHWYAVSFAGSPMWQLFMLGGVDKEGKDATNDTTYLIMDAAEEIKMANPPLALRLHKGTPQKLMDKATYMIQEGLANPALFNDEVAIPIAIQKGGSVADARDWTVIGCVEPHEGGGTDGSTTGGWMNSVKCMELALNNGVDPLTYKQIGPKTGDPLKFKSRQDIIDATKKQLVHFWDLMHEGYSLVVPNHMKRLPIMLGSLIVDGCIENGMSVQEGGPNHIHVGTFFTGAASLADSIAAIDEFVFKQKKLTMKELLDILKADFEGYERERLMFLNNAPKFGNNVDEVDEIAREIVNHCAEHVQKYKDARGGSWCLGNMSITVNIEYGEHVGATPDGRYAYNPLSDNAGPVMGRDTNGPTAMINSVASMEQEQCYDGTLCNLRFDPRGVGGKEGRKIIEGIINTYFKNGGYHLQINVVDTDTLRKAQEEPENYRDIVVRVAGYMAFFTELNKVAQDTIIERTAHLDN